ncbi:hypothetical protein BP5796_12214 [Coleophoma crateriformis]|uniref:protein-ribulosamine 3-kinase n=1 Tax=Coleophoma crateriformis TaxID=565419 RepID=A0A3D8QA02_9HELO|nr:hypothetical protein BP5796_12214 [Coleophoma crateriformis]
MSVKPIAYGTCSSIPDTHFFISEFKRLSSDLGDVESFRSAIATMHKRSAVLHQKLFESGQIPAKFGFHVPTHLGMLPLETGWHSSWTAFFTLAMKSIMTFEREAQGPSEEMECLEIRLLKEVVPRLLTPLENGPNKIQPVLVHGDLMLGNARKDQDTNKPTLYDAGSFWAHNECDLGKWGAARYHIGPEYFDEYHKHIPKSAPEEDWEDRIILYTIRNNLLSASHYGDRKDLRNLALRDMRFLVEKYGNNGDARHAEG